MIVTKVLISKLIKIMEFVFAPHQIIMRGPKATFGSELSIVKYGSSTSERNGINNKQMDVKREMLIERIKLIKISKRVIPI